MNRSELLQKWKGNKGYTLKLISAMPDEYWDFKPTPEVKSFRSQFAHLTTWMRTHSRFVTGVTMEKPSVKTREDILWHLTEFFDALLAYLKEADEGALDEIVPVFYGKRSKEFILQVMDNHLSHHRGQVVVYLRLCRVVPPGYRGW
ncbi:DinB family protein [Lewinella sp. 4G2]|uniref:DinB family protein n=1 Tax=Lewinella sp. 4G2 TaxID=1803372 RepID=UPI0007B46974|nr:DinB family protein [Lewinella sp. 4G2]OAV45185.1 hypothetical protein A3850_012080 [Lewinella sp. 4G2]